MWVSLIHGSFVLSCSGILSALGNLLSQAFGVQEEQQRKWPKKENQCSGTCTLCNIWVEWQCILITHTPHNHVKYLCFTYLKDYTYMSQYTLSHFTKIFNTRTVKWVTYLFKMSLFFFRLLITGPVSHYIYHLLEVLLPNTVPYCLIKRLLLERLIFAPAFLLLFYVVMNALEVMFHSWDESDFLLCCTEIYAFLNTAQQYYFISALCLHLPHFLDNNFVVITVIDMLTIYCQAWRSW